MGGQLVADWQNMNNLSLVFLSTLTSLLLSSLFDDIEEKTQKEIGEKQLDKRSLQYVIPEYDYNLLFQEVIPLNLSFTEAQDPRKGKVRKLKKIPLRFQEVVEVSKENEPSIVQPKKVKQIKRYSVDELEKRFPSILQEKSSNSLENYPYDEVYEIKKLPTKYIPSQPVRKVRPVYNSYREKIRELESNRGILREVNLGSNKIKRNNSKPPVGPETGGEEEQSLFDVIRSADGENTQIIISLSSSPQIKLYNDGPGRSSALGPTPSDLSRSSPPAPPPAALTDSYGVPLDLETTNRPSTDKGEIYQDDFGSTGTFSYNFSKYSEPLKSPSFSIDVLSSSDLELTTPRLPVLSPAQLLSPQSAVSEYSAPQAPPITLSSYTAPLAPPLSYSIDITTDNSQRSPLPPPTTYVSPFKPQLIPAQPPAPPSPGPPSPPAPPPVTTSRPVTIRPTTVHHVHTHTHTHNYLRPAKGVSYSISSQSSSVSSSARPRPNLAAMDSMTAPTKGNPSLEYSQYKDPLDVSANFPSGGLWNKQKVGQWKSLKKQKTLFDKIKEKLPFL